MFNTRLMHRPGLQRQLPFPKPQIWVHRLPQPRYITPVRNYPFLTSRFLHHQAFLNSQRLAGRLLVPIFIHKRGLGTVNNAKSASAGPAKSGPDPTTNLPSGPVTKSRLLEQASSLAARLWIHIKWPLKRNNRPFSLDDFSAFASWLVMGQVLWVILGTTTFVLVAMYLIDTLDHFWNTIQGLDLAGKSTDESLLGHIAGRVLSHGLGARIVFEKGNVLPQLEDGMLKFKNVTILLAQSSPRLAPLDYSARISSLNLSLSFKKWYEGKGLIYDMEIFGMHAKVARSDGSSENEAISTETYTPTFNSLALSFSGHHDSYDLQNDLNEHKFEELTRLSSPTGFAFLHSEYELAQVIIRDSFVEIHENDDASAFKISIFNCDLPRLRGDRLLIDFFNANIVTGTVNNSMFTIHKHQAFLDSDNIVTFKLDGIDMGSLSTANPKLKFNWLVGGKAEIVADIRLPNFDTDISDTGNRAAETSGFFLKILKELGDLTNPKPTSTDGPSSEGNLLKGALMALYETFAHGAENKVHSHDGDYVIVNAKVKFTDLKASLPPHLPMASSASVPFITLQNLRSLISYINGLESEKPLVIKTTVIEKLADLYNTDSISQTKIYDSITGDIYDELLRMIKLDEKRIIREKSNMWSHSVMSQLLLLGLGVLA